MKISETKLREIVRQEVRNISEGILNKDELKKAKEAYKVYKDKAERHRRTKKYKQAVFTLMDIAEKYSDRPVRTIEQALRIIDFEEPKTG